MQKSQQNIETEAKLEQKCWDMCVCMLMHVEYLKEEGTFDSLNDL